MNEIRRPIVEWTRQNLIPDDFADDAIIRVDEVCRKIEVEMFMRTADGDFMLHGGGYLFTEMRTFPLLVDPPTGLLDAYARLQAGIREERGAVASLKVQTLAAIIAELHEGGHGEAANWLVSRQLAANLTPARQLVRFEAEVARFGPRADGGVSLRPGCSVHVRDDARLYQTGGVIVGVLDWCDVKDGVLVLSGRAVPRVAAELVGRSTYPSLDVFVREWADEPTRRLAKSAEIMSAMVQDIGSYPWAPKLKEGGYVRP